jgi:signal transduction histidine kinase
VSESLSNVLRHTSSKSAFVDILCEDSRLAVKVGNEARVDADGIVEFMPRSINERVRALGGETFVEHDADGYTVVRVSIPLQ